MARPMKPLVRGGGYYPSNRWTPLVYAGGYTTANGGGEPEPPPIEKTITGNPIHITDALAKPVQALSIALDPIQDLNGYSYPWPAGGGKNLFDKSNIVANKRIGTTGNEISDNDYFTTTYISVVVGTSYTKNSPVVNVYHRFCTYSSENEFVRKVDNSNTITIEEGESYLRFCGLNTELDTTQLEIGTSSTTYAPYSNICPISGWTGANVTRTGKNLFDPTTFSSRSNYYDVNDDGSVKIKASDSSEWNSIPIISLKAGTYTISINDYTSGNYQVETSEDNYTSPTHKRYDAAFTFTLTKDGGIKVKMGTGGATLPQTVKPILNIGYTADSYSPYSGDTYSITFPSEAGTVYGGTLDVTTGVLTVNWAMVDLGALTWYAATSQRLTRFRAPVIGIKQIGSPNVLGAIVCSSYATKTANQTYTGSIGISLQQNANDVYIYDPQKETFSAADFKSAMSGVQLCYELATPQTYQLTPTEVTMLLGENNIWSDAGNITMTYFADGNASDEEALGILLGNRYVNNHSEDEPTDSEALGILLGGNER